MFRRRPGRLLNDLCTFNLRPFSTGLLNWFKNNRLKNNLDKCHVLVSRTKPIDIKLGDYTIDNKECEKLLGVKNRRKL